ncbi:phospholipase A2 [Xylaria bambusicola]|uniref:phospholipase A2 n=1 Tax=Xylaria bambusicola TaxID=326684 RepID=UPI0020088B02|nr:phospholipase A2 [Xylaria bambusicola]KAI0514437.1 phospholipase A2 [Xylaria bambusicola]
MEAHRPEDSIAELLTTYNELNSSHIEELDEEPSPLEFMRYVARNTPFVVRRGAQDWTATRTWNAAYLRSTLAGHNVNVAITPYGNADSPTLDGQGHLVFAKPHEEDHEFSEFLEFLTRQEKTISPDTEDEVRYAQTQNDNLRHEYITLFSQVEKSIAFARIALERDPDAINMWIGNSRSVTALHRDNYENIYVQIAGCKHFVLLPPLFQPCVNEQDLEPATYVRTKREDATGNLVLRMDEASDGNGDQVPKVPFALWDPDAPEVRATSYSHLAEPMRVTLEPGDMLYLPAMWYHKVSQSCSEDGICVAVNYWYDMEFSGPLYSLCSFVRNMNLSSRNPMSA